MYWETRAFSQNQFIGHVNEKNNKIMIAVGHVMQLYIILRVRKPYLTFTINICIENHTQSTLNTHLRTQNDNSRQNNETFCTNVTHVKHCTRMFDCFL